MLSGIVEIKLLKGSNVSYEIDWNLISPNLFCCSEFLNCLIFSNYFMSRGSFTLEFY